MLRHAERASGEDPQAMLHVIESLLFSPCVLRNLLYEAHVATRCHMAVSAELLEWCRNGGVKWHGIKAGFVSEGWRGVLATQELPPGWAAPPPVSPVHSLPVSVLSFQFSSGP